MSCHIRLFNRGVGYLKSASFVKIDHPWTMRGFPGKAPRLAFLSMANYTFLVTMAHHWPSAQISTESDFAIVSPVPRT